MEHEIAQIETEVDTCPDATIHLTAGRVSLLVDISKGRLPSILHWGAALAEVDAEVAAVLVRAVIPVIGSNNVSEPPRPAILPEHHTGWVGRPGLTGSFDGTGWSPRFRSESVSLNGVPVSGFVESEQGLLRVDAQDDSGRLQLRLEIELEQSGLVRARSTIKNLGEEKYSLDELSLTFPIPGEATEVLDFTGVHNYERVPQRTTMTTGVHLREQRKGRTGADSAYVLHAGTPGFGFGHGEVWAIHTAWSGNHRHYAERVSTGEQVLGGGEVLLPGEVKLSSGESYQTPWVYASFGNGLDQVARRFHRHLRAREPFVDPDRPVTLNVWEAVYFHQDLDQLLDLAERAATLGVERYVLDDGWFGCRRDDFSGLGDWTVSADVWPDGLHPLINRVRQLGMQFGLWFEPEMVNLDSELARAHPAWIMAARTSLPIESRNQHVLNLALPEAYEHIKARMLAILAEYPIDYIKWDHNRDLTEAGDQTNGGRPVVHAQTLAFYRLLAELRAAHPGLEIESCSSGGARVDLGVLEHADRVWVSDNIDPHDRQAMLRWTAQLLPPEFMGSHIASGRSYTTGRQHDLSFRAGTAIFGHLGIEWDLAQATVQETDELRSWVEFYKQERRLLLGGDMVRMDTPHDDILVHGVINNEKSRAIFASACTDSTYPDPAVRLKFRELDPAARYRVRPVFPGRTPSGLQAPRWWGRATANGVHIDELRLRDQPLTSVRFAGATLSGEMLHTVGVAAPRLHPDQVVIYVLDRVEAPHLNQPSTP
ncbi:alpha-galactosidase [Cryobacterium sp. TMT2-15-1]|uniref:alpha-galactosidase n=1 Tax=Cryobacterium sp. TMT2-15-1 TaxID=1259246 RepID=UPI00106B9D70|nr:alpha-galactosidase [Cryobacterium sp. TMT2-15-1]TFC55796.1 alpha-galactosidase [Cryobacterium sp. TMT2-15-1]